MIKVGIAGIGFMGMIHFLSYGKVRGAKVVALCEQEKKRLKGDWRGIKGNFGPTGTQMDLSGIRTFEDLDEMIADPEIDLIDVCLPPSLHADVTVRALRAGKHVFCEKPIALNIRDAKRMVAAAGRAGRILMIGHVLPFTAEYARARQLIESGKYGRLLGGSFRRIISDPKWLRGFFDPQRIGGPMLDLHVHDAHFIRLLCGMPKAVFTTGRMRGEVAEYFTTQFLFDDPDVAVTATSGVINQQGRGFMQAFEIHLEQATLLFDFAVIGDEPRTLMPLTVLDARGRAACPKLGPSDPVDAFELELKEVVRAIRAGVPSPILAGDLACDALTLCHKETQSLRTGRLVKL
ncbi:MAG: Gfo/Idh/MocA family protein [Pirellulales bacterium]